MVAVFGSSPSAPAISLANNTVLPFGSLHPDHGYRSEDLSRQSFPDGSFDVVVTQDVFEHVFDPAAAIAEIARTLKPGGIYVMSVPIVRKEQPSVRRAVVRDGKVVHLLPPEYHGNPIDPSGVTVDWGYDIATLLSTWSGLVITLHSLDDLSRGIRAEYHEIVVGRKPASLPVI